MSFMYRLATNISHMINVHIFGLNRLSPIFLLNLDKRINWSDVEPNHSLIDDIMSDGFVFATQKKRRTVERRLRRRFGVEGYPDSCAIIRPKHNIIVCHICGHYHELHTICGNCYQKVKAETDLILEEVRKGVNCYEPIDKEVEIRYKSDRRRSDSEVNDKRVVEMDRQRPEWFAKNLMSTTVGNKWIETNVIVKEDEPKVTAKD